MPNGVACLLLSLGLWGNPVPASSGSEGAETLLDTLHRKGIVSDEEYKQLQTRDKALDKVLKFLGGTEI